MEMQYGCYTENYQLLKPDDKDFYDVNHINSNMDIVDEELNKLNQKTIQLDETVVDISGLIGETENTGIETNVYGITEYLMLALVMLSTVLLIVTLVLIISAFAKSTKEAGTYITPLMIVVMLVGLSGMFTDGAKTELFYYLIPIYNSVQSMTGIFSFDILPSGMAASVASNIVYTGIGVFILTRMFNNEKIMFNK